MQYIHLWYVGLACILLVIVVHLYEQYAIKRDREALRRSMTAHQKANIHEGNKRADDISVQHSTPQTNINRRLPAMHNIFPNPERYFDKLPEGIRNNNPGNIDGSASIHWHGQVGTDKAGRVIFSHMYWGIRAIIINLYSYQHNDGCKTITDIITRWAPPSENDTAAYIRAVSASVGHDADEDIDVSDYMFHLLYAICAHENGRVLVSSELTRNVVLDFHNSLKEANNNG